MAEVRRYTIRTRQPDDRFGLYAWEMHDQHGVCAARGYAGNRSGAYREARRTRDFFVSFDAVNSAPEVEGEGREG